MSFVTRVRLGALEVERSKILADQEGVTKSEIGDILLRPGNIPIANVVERR